MKINISKMICLKMFLDLICEVFYEMGDFILFKDIVLLLIVSLGLWEEGCINW